MYHCTAEQIAVLSHAQVEAKGLRSLLLRRWSASSTLTELQREEGGQELHPKAGRQVSRLAELLPL